MLKAIIKIVIVALLIYAALACGRKEAPPQPKGQETPAVTDPQPKEQEDPTLTAVKALLKRWDQAFNSNDPNKLMEIIPNEVRERLPEEKRKILTGVISEFGTSLKDMNTSVERIVIEDNEQTKATVYVTCTAINLKTQKPSSSRESTSYPIVKDAGEWKFDILRWIESGQKNSEAATARAKTKPKSHLNISLSYEYKTQGYHVCYAEVYNEGDETASISPSNFVLVTGSDESVEGQIPFESGLIHYKNLLNLHILPKTRTSGYLFFRTPGSVQYVVFLPTGVKIPVSGLK